MIFKKSNFVFVMTVARSMAKAPVPAVTLFY
jgi:hypothetical protein